MRSKTIKILKYDELDDDAKARAREWYREGWEYHWGEDAVGSLRALAEHFGGRMVNWDIDYSCAARSSAEFSMPDLSAFEIRNKLGQLGRYNPATLKGIGDCKLTGICFDEGAIDGFREAWAGGERDLTELMRAAFESWAAEVQSDVEWNLEDEQVAESIIANEYEFDESGARYAG